MVGKANKSMKKILLVTLILSFVSISSFGQSELSSYRRAETLVNRAMRTEAVDDFNEACNYINNIMKNDRPEDGEILYDYAVLCNKLLPVMKAKALGMTSLTDLNGVFFSATATTLQLNRDYFALYSSAAGYAPANQLCAILAAEYGGNGATYNGGANNNSGNRIRTGGKTCSYCNGKGWVAGSKGVWYPGSSGYYCSECGRDVNPNHSHDRCPSCNGRGVTP